VNPFPNSQEFRVPPQDLEAEQSVLGAMMLSSEAVDVVVENSSEEDFYREAHRKLYKAILSLNDRKEPIDVITLTNELKRMGEFDTIGGISALTALVERVPTAANAEYYAQIVKEKSALRRLVIAAAQVQADAYSDALPVREILDKAESLILEATEQRRKNGFDHIKEIIVPVYEEIPAHRNQANLIDGVPTGFNQLDLMTMGMQRANLIVLGARPSLGKTALALNITWNASSGKNSLRKKFPVGFFSIEMTKKELARRLLSSVSGVDWRKARTGELMDSERTAIARAMHDITEAPIHLDDSGGITILELKASARRLKRAHDIQLLVVDYLQLIQAGVHKDNREQEIAFISRQLKQISKDLNIPVLCLSQLSRPGKGMDEKEPVLSDLRESGAIEQDADVVVFIHRKSFQEDDSKRFEHKLIVAKQRNGPIDEIPVNFNWRCTRFDGVAEEWKAAPLPKTAEEIRREYIN
jgi:replicative DNA helicase